jgi:hypothetical protein
VLLVGDAPATVADASNNVTDLRLFADGKSWNFNDGREFPGAKGHYDASPDEHHPAGILSFDFTHGGNYVDAERPVSIAPAAELRFAVKSAKPRTIMIRLIDATKQCHQYSRPYFVPGSTQTLRIDLAKPSPEHWGGANNGRIKFPLTEIVLGVDNSGGDDAKAGDVEFWGVHTLP